MWDPGWDELFRKNEWGRYPPEELVRFVARNFYKAPDRAAVRFLELGCGPGANLWFLAREGFSATGIDGSAVALDRARRRLDGEGLKAELTLGDASKLPYPDASFDCVLDVECIYANSWEDSLRILAEARRVLKPGGLLFSKAFMTGMPKEALHQDYGLIRLTSEEELPKLYAGFSSLEYDSLIRTDRNRKHEVREWIVTARK
ncbi:MAG: class I SAM-dependent methyltransferase [Elusimicrobia bacterium]|nr:class I SAM-dependent methyltransferase [Elusimicrobiota bacterium]